MSVIKGRNLDSKEFKIILNNNIFEGDTLSIVKKVIKFKKVLESCCSSSKVFFLDKIKFKDRFVKYYDTLNYDFKNNGYILRQRMEISKNSKELSLKYRTTDKLDCMNKKIEGSSKIKIIYEEDILANHKKLYSLSAKTNYTNNEELNDFSDITSVYPILKDEFSYHANEPLIPVKNILILEKIIDVGNVILDDLQSLGKAQIILWYKYNEKELVPIISEISLKIKSKNGNFKQDLEEKTGEIINNLLEFKEWVSDLQITKVDNIYKYLETYA